MLLWQLLFGGGTSSSTPKDLTPPELKELRQPFSDAVKGLIAPGGIPSYKGPLTTPITGAEKTTLGDLSQYQTHGGDLAQKYLNQTIKGRYLPGQGGDNPFLQAAIKAAQRPTLQGLTETLSRSLPSRFTKAGQFVQPQGSSAFDRAAAIASRGAGQSMADIATNIASGAYEAERGRQQQAVQLSQQQVQTTIATLQAQALPRLIRDMGITRGMDEFHQRLQALMQALNIAGSGSTPIIGNQQNQTTMGGLIPSIMPHGVTPSGL